MTHELAQKRLDYWMGRLNLYEHTEVLAAAQTHPQLAKVVKRLGWKIPKEEIKVKSKAIYVPALDNWHPNYRGDKVAVTWREDEKRISIWGDDDFGMELLNADEEIFKELISQPITQIRCKKMGFKPCG